MDIELFVERFKTLTGHRPYLWQTRLYESLLAGEQYTALDLPTGLGKTSIIPLWLLARADGAPLPRRLVYVVDRRAVVDQATAVADEIADRLHPQATGIAADLRAALGLTGAAVLPVSTLRGQHVDNRRWFEDPGATAIVVGTVDMIGSRLLFQGYGVSPGMRPVHAGLLGVGSLFVIDEAHLVPPFEAMVRQAGAMGDQDWSGAPERLASSLRLVSLSATGRERPGATVFRLTDQDQEDSPVHMRLKAAKRLRILPEATPNSIAERLAGEAWSFGQDGRRVVVFCNSRRTAQAVESGLADRVRKEKDRFGKGARLTELLVGERRYRERLFLTGSKDLEIAASPVFARFEPGAPPDPDGRPAFLIATSAGEVGIDLDADDLVCDLVPWERMVQRLGRVNRRANPGEARISVVPVAKDKEAEDDISDEDLRRLRAPFDSPLWRYGDDGAKDASPDSLGKLKLEPGLAAILLAASTPEPLRPPLTRPTLESWALTSLEQHTGRPNVQPWLRGWAQTEQQTTMVWRRLFPLRPGDETAPPSRDLKAFFEVAAPPHASESLSASSWRVAQILRECAGAFLKAVAKRGSGATMDAGFQDEDVPAPSAHCPIVVMLSADQTVNDVWSPVRLAEADVETLTRTIANGTVILDARLGGLDENGLLDAKAKTDVLTIDVQPRALWGLPLETTAGRRITLGDRPAPDGYWRLDEFRWSSSDGDDADSLWIEVWRGPGANPGDPAISRQPQALSDHHTETGRHAARIAESLGLRSPWRELLVAAAEAHDLGKDRTLWQNAMNARRDAGRPYAKTEGGGDGRALNGYRHEFGSLRDVLASPGSHLPPIVADDPDLRELALHLIVAHHGRTRPTIKAYDPDQLPSQSPGLSQDAALRFARLQARWGPWGLAWWESLLRAADWAASRALNDAFQADRVAAMAMERAGG